MRLWGALTHWRRRVTLTKLLARARIDNLHAPPQRGRRRYAPGDSPGLGESFFFLFFQCLRICYVAPMFPVLGVTSALPKQLLEKPGTG